MHCNRHGQSKATFVCQHLARGRELGFYFAHDPGNPRPNAWCRECDAVLARVGEWNDESEAFAGIMLLCSCCYDDAKSRNCDRHFKFLCDSCSEIHQGIPGYGWSCPADYSEIPEAERADRVELTDDTCVIDQQYFYLRGTLEIPVIDASESLIFGAWVCVTKASFDQYLQVKRTDKWQDEAPLLGLLCTSIKGYPETLDLKTEVHFRGPDIRPTIELEPTDHPLAVQQREGVFMNSLQEIYSHIAPGKVKPIDVNE